MKLAHHFHLNCYAVGCLLLLTLLAGCSPQPDWNLTNESTPDLAGHWVAYPGLFALDVEADDKGYKVSGGALLSIDKSQHEVTFSGTMSADGRIISLIGEVEQGKEKTRGLPLVMLGACKTYESEQAFLDGEELFKDPRMTLKGPITVLVLRVGLAQKDKFLNPDWSQKWGSITHGTSQHLILQ